MFMLLMLRLLSERSAFTSPGLVEVDKPVLLPLYMVVLQNAVAYQQRTVTF